MMIPRIASAEYVGDFIIRFEFTDGTAGDVDFAEELWGEVFEPLRELSFFQQFRLDQELNTVVWPTGADFAPEFLHERALAAGIAAAKD